MRGILYGLLALLAIATGFVAYQLLATGPAEQAYGGPFTLTDMHGKPITEQALRGHPSVVFFGFTHCPEVCPTTLFELNGWLAQLGDEGKDIKGFFFSVDPERDTPEVLGQYITNVTDRVTGITGSPEKMAEVIRDWRIYARKIPTDEGRDYTMDHTASILLLNAHGGFEGTIAYGESAETALAKLKRLASGK
ncbi:MAG: SCO family protein [Notoacmeibacter sp.]|nr:SCO family protein [Notoacmeibacter sp.]MCC0032067.1 SCO family protein [Brucellaceae bacterium]